MRTFAIVVSLCALACGEVRSGPAQSPQTTTGSEASVQTSQGSSLDKRPIIANISVSPDRAAKESDIQVLVTIENHSSEPLVFSEEEFSSPNALFEVRNHLGEKILPAPPPVISGRERTIAPGKRAEIKMSLAGMFSPPLPPGEYNVRLRRISSTPHAFRIGN